LVDLCLTPALAVVQLYGVRIKQEVQSNIVINRRSTYKILIDSRH